MLAGLPDARGHATGRISSRCRENVPAEGVTVTDDLDAERGSMATRVSCG
jgi:hypothetical protein